MIGPEHDNRVVGMAARLQRIEHAPDLAIDEANRRQVGRHEIAPLSCILEKLQPRLGQLPVQIPAEAGRVVTVVAADLGQDDRVERVHVVPLLRHVAGHVGQEEPGGQEEGPLLRPVQRSLQLFDGPAGDLPVALVLVLVREGPPIHQGVVLRRLHQLFLGAGSHSSRRSQVLELGIRLGPPEPPVVDLAGGVGGVAVALEVLRQRLDVLQRLDLAEPRSEPVNPGAGGPAAGQQAGARRIAQWRLCLGVEKGRAARGQPVHVRRLHLRVAPQRPHPIVEVVDRDEQDVGLGRGRLFGRAGRQQGGNRNGSAGYPDAMAHGNSGRYPTTQHPGTGAGLDPMQSWKDIAGRLVSDRSASTIVAKQTNRITKDHGRTSRAREGRTLSSPLRQVPAVRFQVGE